VTGRTLTVFAVLLVIFWGTTVARLPTLWRDRRQRTLWASVFAMALCTTAAYPPVRSAVDIPILPHLLGLLAAFFLLRFIAQVNGTGGQRWQTVGTVAVISLLGALALLSGGIHTRPERLGDDLGWSAVAYWVVLETYLSAVLVSATALFWTIARVAPAGLPRLGLRTMAAGSVLLATYAVGKGSLVVMRGFGLPIDFIRIEPRARALQGLGLLLVAAGGLIPATRRIRSAGAAYRNLLVLRPLWTAMRDAFPEVILFSPRRAVIELAGVDDVHLRLYRRVIEIRDGMLALRAWLPDTPPGTGPEAEAARIAGALRRRADGVAPADRVDGWASVGPEMADEVAWLSRVSRAYRRIRPRPRARTPRPSGSAR
jgi:hypothetical protein